MTTFPALRLLTMRGRPTTTQTLFPLLLLLSNLPQIISQALSILPTTPSETFPACAFSCANLNQASSYCLQTNVDASQEAVNSCFCQRAEVIPFYQGASGVCDAFCPSTADLSVLQTWFQSYCAAAGINGAGGTVTTLITSTRIPTATATGSSRTGSTSSAENNGWFASHWKWVMMLIILIVGLTALALLAVCLKRRHARKVEQRRAAASGFPASRGGSSPDIGHGRDMWGPHQHMAHTRGWEYTTEQDREMREASDVVGGGIPGAAVRKQPSKKLGKRSRHGSQRSVVYNESDANRVREEGDEHTRSATASVRRSKSERKRERVRERERDKEVESGLRGLPITDEKSTSNTDETAKYVMSEKEKDIS